MARFADALDRNMEDIQRPAPLPPGHYVTRVSKAPGMPREIAGKPYEILTINLEVISAQEDVDPEMLEAYGAVAKAPLRLDFIFNTDPEEKQKFESTLNRLKQFIENCGVEVQGGQLKEALASVVNAQLIAEVRHRMDPNDPEVVYAEVGRTAAI
jgi:hypothetical protein